MTQWRLEAGGWRLEAESLRLFSYVAVLLLLVQGCTPHQSEDTTPIPPQPDQVAGEPTYRPQSEEWVHMPVRILFPDGGGDLDAQSRAMVRELQAAIANRTDITRIRVEGHADESPSSEENHRVARERAESVVNHMVNALGLPREMFEVVNYGDEQPLTSDTASADRVQNRRVEFSLLVQRDGEGGRGQMASAAPPPEATSNARQEEPSPRAVADAASHAPLLIYSAQLVLAVHEVRERINQTIEVARQVGGFLQSQSSSGIVIRVPADRFWEAMTQLESLGDVLDREVSAQDVSEEVRDLRIRLRNALQMRERLEVLLERARTVPDSLTIERELERITRNIELLRGQIEALQYRISYSTITLRFDAVAVEQEDVPRERFRLPFRFLQRIGLNTLMELDQ